MVENKGIAGSKESALALIRSVKPDLVFLDIQLQDTNAFALLDILKDIDFKIIFTTAFAEYAIKAFRYEARYPDGTQEVLLDVPNYDFNWQLKYILEEPKRLPKGTVVECTAIYDNSAKNPSNPDPSKSVHWGDQSFDEMMIGFMDTVGVR